VAASLPAVPRALHPALAVPAVLDGRTPAGRAAAGPALAGPLPQDPADIGAALEDVVRERDLRAVERLVRAAVLVDRLDPARSRLLELAERARSGTSVTEGICALVLLSTEAFTTGDWRAAEAWTSEGLRLCRAHGFGLLAWSLELPRALVHAATGDHDAVARVADRMRAWATPRHAGAVAHAALHATALDALGRGDHEAAYRAASATGPPGTVPPHAVHAGWISVDLVEAAVHAGHPEDAAAHVAAMEAAGLHRLPGRPSLVVAGSRAIAAPELRRDLFAAALATPDAARWPFELARIELAYGQRLRRRRAAADARTHLQSALATFRGLGAHPWADRTERELLATSPTKRTPRVGGDLAALTPQERQVATLAAAGLANRQIADRLLISPRTVGTHLQHVFVKLSVPNRAGLHHALAAHGSTAPPARGTDGHRRDRHATDAR
jgi:ATP/maltotriose-dependent transcriptional regulator MalT